MILECWTLSIRTDQTNAPQRANQVIYNRMSLLLKSLLSVTVVMWVVSTAKCWLPYTYINAKFLLCAQGSCWEV